MTIIMKNRTVECVSTKGTNDFAYPVSILSCIGLAADCVSFGANLKRHLKYICYR